MCRMIHKSILNIYHLSETFVDTLCTMYIIHLDVSLVVTNLFFARGTRCLVFWNYDLFFIPYKEIFVREFLIFPFFRASEFYHKERSYDY